MQYMLANATLYGCMVDEKCYLHAMPEQFTLENTSFHPKLLLF